MPAESKKRTLPNWLLLAALLVLFLAARLPALGRFVTTDEALWFRRSANFYLAISEGDWASTFQSEHPGAITLWAGAAGFLLRFPGYADIGDPEVHDSELLRLMENRGIGPMQVLGAGRAALVGLHAAAFAVLWPFAVRRLSRQPAAIGMALLALDPFLIAHQRLLHLDGLLASLMLLAVLAWWDYLHTPSRFGFGVSAAATGLALLTKTPAWFLFPFIFGLTLFQAWKIAPKRERTARLRPLLGLCGLSLVILVLGFPAMWQAPLLTLQNMFGYALGSAQGEFSGPLFFLGRVYPQGDFGWAGLLFYPLSFLWRSTPLVLIGLACAAFVRAARKNNSPRPADKQTIWVLLAFALSFMVFMTIAEKKFDRYLLPALPALLLIAGWGWHKLAITLAALRKPAWHQPALLAAVAVLQLASAAFVFPYYLSYYNPVLRAVIPVESQMQLGWGEGLDQAAAYLNQHAARTDRVASWYSTAFNLMYPAQAADIPIALNLSQTQLDDLLSLDYLVIYVHQWQRTTPQNLLTALAQLEPEHVVTINGIDYAKIYRLR